MKQQLRKYYKSLRSQLSAQQVVQNSTVIQQALFALPAWQQAKTVMCYLSFQNEVDTTEIYRQGWAKGKTMLIPICAPSGGLMDMSRLDDFGSLIPNRYGILEQPKNLQQIVDPGNIDLCIIPGISFDRAGNRIGFGAGYYDRYLPKVNFDVPRVALAHYCQLAENLLPTDSYDLPMDMILTEQEIIVPKKHSC